MTSVKTPEKVALARELRGLGQNWAAIGKALDCDRITVRCWLDNVFHQKHIEQTKLNRHKREAKRGHEKGGRWTFSPQPRKPITLAPVPPRRGG